MAGDTMKLYHWVAIGAAGALLTASAAAVVISSQTPTESKETLAAVKNERGRPAIRESQIRQPPAAAPSPAPVTSAPERVETTKDDSWIVVCRESLGSPAKKSCLASLRVANPNQRELLLNWQIGLNNEGHFVTAFHVPTGVAVKRGDQTLGGGLLIQNGVELKFGKGSARRLSYVSCAPQQCFAEALIDDAFVKEAVANSQATVTVYSAGAGAIPLEFSIKGIDKAIQATRK